MARPIKKVDKEQVEKLAALQCTMEEIAAFVSVDKSTISRRYATEVAKGRGQGKTRLRKYQWDLAKKSPAMAIFLGKNYLGQSDSQEPAPIETDVPKDIDSLTPEQVDEYYDKLRAKAN